MRAAWTLLALVGATLWFVLWAPQVERGLLEARADAPRAPSAGDIERSWLLLAATDPAALPDEALAEKLRTGLIQARWMQLRQERLTESIWHTLSTSERAEGTALLGRISLPRYEGDVRFVEPDTPTLTHALMSRYGNATEPIDPLPPPDPNTDRHQQLRAAAVLAHIGALTDHQAAQILWAALQLIDLQRDLHALEAELTQALNPELQAAIGSAPAPKATPQR